jgi:hypothetical protein
MPPDAPGRNSEASRTVAIDILTRRTGCHSANEWARDDDGDGIREVHVNSNEGGWTGLRNFLRSFRGVHKKYLAGYVAILEFAVNHKQVSPQFISTIVRLH